LKKEKERLEGLEPSLYSKVTGELRKVFCGGPTKKDSNVIKEKTQ